MRGNRWAAVLAVFVAMVAFLPGRALAKGPGLSQSTKGVELRDTLRDLWVDHIFWVRAVAWGTKLGDTEAAKVAEAHAVQAAKALGAAIVPYYGRDAGDKLVQLLAGHYGAVKSYMTAAYADDRAAKATAVKEMNANGNEIASFLSNANPNWPLVGLVSLLSTHVAHHIDEIDAIEAKNYTAEAESWGAMKKHVYAIADALVDTLVKQFPRKF